MEKKIVWDVAVIGGGPAGLMAAGRAAECGAEVLLMEKNETLGKKLLITGGGRCNLTNNETDVRKFLEKFKDRRKFLFSAFAQWSVEETLDFFHSRKLETKVEEGGRVFPISDKAASVFKVLTDYVREGRVTVALGNPVREIIGSGGKIGSLRLENGAIVYARAFVLATGGKSRPETGSTGDGFGWLEKLGHVITPPDPSLVPLAIKDGWVKKLPGVVLPDIKLTAFQNGVKQISRKGRVLFTHVGISGPTVLNMSKDVGELMKYGTVTLSIDLFPELGYGDLNAKLQAIFKENSNKKFRNILGSFIPVAALQPIVVERSGINPNTFCHSITREERLGLIKLLKEVSMQVDKLLGAEKAIVTSGGVSPAEIDFKTMRSRLFPNLYIVGDLLDIDRPSGGYSLQLCWTTGYVAGTAAARTKKSAT